MLAGGCLQADSGFSDPVGDWLILCLRRGAGKGAHVGAAGEGGAHNALVGSAAQCGTEGGDFLHHRGAVSQRNPTRILREVDVSRRVHRQY